MSQQQKASVTLKLNPKELRLIRRELELIRDHLKSELKDREEDMPPQERASQLKRAVELDHVLEGI